MAHAGISETFWQVFDNGGGAHQEVEICYASVMLIALPAVLPAAGSSDLRGAWGSVQSPPAPGTAPKSWEKKATCADTTLLIRFSEVSHLRNLVWNHAAAANEFVLHILRWHTQRWAQRLQ